MTRIDFFSVALLMSAVCLAATSPTKVFAMGTKSGFEQIRKDEIQKEQNGKSAEEKDRRGKELRKEQTGEKEEKSAPEKKPRLKYWDPYECGC